MIHIKVIRENPGLIQQAARNRGMEVDVDAILGMDSQRRDALYQVEQKKALRNETSKKVGELRKAGEDATEMIAAMRRLGDEIRELDERTADIEAKLHDALLELPNIPRDEVPVGEDKPDNEIVRTWGEKPRFDFAPKPHWAVGEALGVMDFDSSAKIAGSRFVTQFGAGAAIERALISFMLDVHVAEHGYTEVWPPHMALPECLVGTGSLPKFEEDLFKLREGLYMVPTAEVPLTNLHRDEILDAGELPKRYTAYTPCYRAEAGAAGKEARGLIRRRQFHKVELMKFCTAEQEDEELEKLVADAEQIVQRLGLHYRVSLLCTGELTFASYKTYDIEGYFPGLDAYYELSSCSIYGEFQSRRCNTRYRPEPGARPRFVRTMNGSGLATGRTLAAIFETYQRADGTVEVPEVLRPYMRGQSVIGL
jgi:seryl-tRNA synthetase